MSAPLTSARGARSAPAAALLAAALLAAAPAAASARPAPVVLSLGVSAGSTLPDPRLGDFQWDTGPRAAWGAFGACARGPWTLGVRLERTSTVQRLELPDGPVAPSVRSTTLELRLQRALVARLGTRLSLDLAAGRRRIDYRPDQLAIPAEGLGAPIQVDLAPMEPWIAGVGASLSHALTRRWALALAVDRQLFALDTAHRSGTAIVDERDAFMDWDARLELACRFPLRSRGAAR